ncbi:hypothetical protein LQZ19_13230 [Treponema primitia]|uniref:hypothetical protein n=1 Tax=Treponema primitia TaxID=88058 RepID=UPI00397FD5ED
MKTFDDYMNDPEIVNEPMGLREIHAVRLKLQDEHDVFSPEFGDYVQKRAEAIAAESGLVMKFAKLDENGNLITRTIGPAETASH